MHPSAGYYLVNSQQIDAYEPIYATMQENVCYCFFEARLSYEELRDDISVLISLIMLPTCSMNPETAVTRSF